MKALLALLLLASSAGAQATGDPYFPLPLFRDGLYTRYSANAIPDGALAEAINVTLDDDVDGVVVARSGYSKYNTSSLPNAKNVRGLWAFDASDNTKFIVAFTSASFYSSSGDGTWTAITGLNSFSLTKDFDCAQTIGKLWCANSDTVFSWNGTSTATVSGAPVGNLVGRFRNRVLISGITGSKGRLRGSGELDGTDYTVQVPGVSTTPFNIAFGGADDGEEITCLMGAYQDAFIVGKRNSLWALYGFGRNDFQVRELSREVGCIDRRSVREKNNCLYWLSLRGVEKFCGASVIRISDPIRDKLDTIVATAGNPRSAVDTSQADFEAGNLSYSGAVSPMSATIAPGSVVPTTFTVTESAFAALTSTLTRVSGGTLQLTPMLSNAGFETGSFTSNWTSSGGFAVETSGSCFGTYEARVATGAWVSASGAVQVLDGTTSAVIFSQARTTPAIGSSSCTSLTLDVSTMTATTIKVRVTDGTNIITSAAFQKPVGVIVMGFRRDTASSASKMRFDFPEPFYASSGTYLSQAYNVGFSTPVWGLFSTTYTFISDYGSPEVRSSIRFETQVSTSLTGVWTATMTTTDTNVVPSQKSQFVRFLVTMQSPFHLGTPTVSAIGLSAATTGYSIGQCRNSALMSSWGTLSCNITQSGDGSVTLAIATGTTCNSVGVSTAIWTATTNNTTISVATASYVAYRAFYNFSSASSAYSNALGLQDCTISWSQGETRPPVASAVYRDRYYLAYTSSTASGASNDHLLVLDKNDKWTLFDNHHCYSLVNYERKIYCGSSTNVGTVWRLDTGTDDDGTIILSKIRTKAFNLGLAERPKIFKRLYLDLEPSPSPTQAISLTGRYTLERSTPTYSLGSVSLNEDPGSIMTSKFPFPLTNPISGRYIQVELESQGLNSPWRLFGGRLYYSPLEPE